MTHIPPCSVPAVALYMFPMGLSSATTVRVSNALGAGLPLGAKRTALTAGTLVFGIELVLTALVIATRGVLGYVFTDVKEVGRRPGRQLLWLQGTVQRLGARWVGLLVLAMCLPA